MNENVGDTCAAQEDLRDFAFGVNEGVEADVGTDVLQLRWLIYADAERWDACLDIAASLTRVAPRCPVNWIYHAQSLWKLGREREAKNLLASVTDDFNTSSAIAYHMARFCCELGETQEAFGWLEKAVAAANGPKELIRLRKQVLEDPVLEPLRGKL